MPRIVFGELRAHALQAIAPHILLGDYASDCAVSVLIVLQRITKQINITGMKVRALSC